MLSKYASSTDLPLSLREHERRPQKDLIAAKAANLLHNGATIILDASSTVIHCVYLSLLTPEVRIFPGFLSPCRQNRHRNLYIFNKNDLFFKMILKILGIFV